MSSFIERVEIFPKRQPNGRILKHIDFRLQIFFNGHEVDMLDWYTDKQVETVGLWSETADVLGRLSSYAGYDGYSQSYKYNAMGLMPEKTAEDSANKKYISGRTLTDSTVQAQNSTSC